MMKAGLMSGFFLAYWLGLFCAGVLILSAKSLPSVESFWEPNRPVSVRILDRNGRDILVRGAQDRGAVNFDELPDHVKDAFLSIEDRRFYAHAGVDPIGLTRAMRENIRAGRVVQGGSTLSQQLAKNVFLSSDKTLHRKFQETLLAVWLERVFTKDEIFSKYLNRVYFGGGTWGLQAASQHYLHKRPEDLTVSEAAMLAGLLKAPSQYNPASNPEAAARRTALVLSAMNRRGQFKPGAYEAALTAPIEVYPPENFDGANYFVDWIWEDLETIVGPPRSDLIIRTSLDIEAQKSAEAAIQTHLDPERGASEVAIVMLDGNGGVRAMVGGTSYRDSQFNRAVQARRQPGSAFKPFVYAAAFEKGLTPWDIRPDAPITLGDWTPRNFKDIFFGDMTLEAAYALSINTVAVRLSEEVGRDRVAELAGRLGLKGLQPLRSIGLGAQDVSPLELTNAYLPFANWGEQSRAYGIVSIETPQNQLIYQRRSEPAVKVLDPQTLGFINHVMMFTVQTGTARRAQIPGRDVGGKTGTTNDFRDAWFVGYVPDLVAGVWVGADDFSPMGRVSGGTIPAAIWRDMMEFYLTGTDTGRLPVSQLPNQPAPNSSLESLLDDIETSLP